VLPVSRLTPCPAAGGTYVDHFGGIARNNAVSAHAGGLFASEGGTDLLGCLRDGEFAAREPVSLSGLSALRGITPTANGGLRIGALMTGRRTVSLESTRTSPMESS